MANRYANLVGANKIKDEYTKINTGFDKVEQEMDAEVAAREQLEDRVDTIINDPSPNKDAELVDIRTPDPTYTPVRTINVAGDITRDMQAQFVSHKADTAIHRPIIISEVQPTSVGDDGNIYLQLYESGESQFEYEVGTFTPALDAQDTSPNGVVYVQQVGHYVRLGKVVTMSITLQISNKGSGGTGPVLITGSPFVGATPQVVSVGEVRGVSTSTYDHVAGLLVNSSGNAFQLRGYDSGQTYSDPGGVAYEEISDNFRIFATFSFIAEVN